MKRLVAAVVVSLVVIGAFAAGAVSAPQRVRAPQNPRTAGVPFTQALPSQVRGLISQTKGRRCATIKCVNRKVNRIGKYLDYVFNQCTQLAGVTEYSG